jgi:hypothetical protein
MLSRTIVSCIKPKFGSAVRSAAVERVAMNPRLSAGVECGAHAFWYQPHLSRFEPQLLHSAAAPVHSTHFSEPPFGKKGQLIPSTMSCTSPEDRVSRSDQSTTASEMEDCVFET